MRASLVAQLGKNPPAMQETTVSSWGGKIRWRRVRLPTPAFLGCPGGSDGKESAHNVEDLGSIPGLGRSPGEGKGHPLQYSSLESSMDWISMASLSRTRVVLKGHLTPEGGVLSPCSGVAAAAAVGVVSRGSGVPLLGFIF